MEVQDPSNITGKIDCNMAIIEGRRLAEEEGRPLEEDYVCIEATQKLRNPTKRVLTPGTRTTSRASELP